MIREVEAIISALPPSVDRPKGRMANSEDARGDEGGAV